MSRISKNDSLEGAWRRRFLQQCGLFAMGTLVPVIFNLRSKDHRSDYMVINGWVIPAGHLNNHSDA